MPSDLPIPTACIRYANSVPITTGTNGNCFINYLPGSALTYNNSNGAVSALTVNTTCSSGVAGTNSFVDTPFFDVPQVYDRWRLVAAEMRVEYTGQVLSQSGMQYSCVHYEPLTVAYKGTTGTGTITGQTNSYVDRLSAGLSLVKTGLWNETHAVTSSTKGRTHLFTPDTSVYTFSCNVGTSSSEYGVYANNNIFVSNASSSGTATKATDTTPTAGANTRNYCWYFTGLPPSTSCLNFVTYEIYEFLPDIGSVGILKLEENLAFDYVKFITTHREKSEKKNHKPWKQVSASILHRLGSFAKQHLPMAIETIASMLV